MTLYPDCARCIHCGRPITGEQALDMPDGPLCVPCYEENEAGAIMMRFTSWQFESSTVADMERYADGEAQLLEDGTLLLVCKAVYNGRDKAIVERAASMGWQLLE